MYFISKAFALVHSCSTYSQSRAVFITHYRAYLDIYVGMLLKLLISAFMLISLAVILYEYMKSRGMISF